MKIDQSLKSWASEHNIYISPNVELAQDQLNGRYLIAKHDIEKGEVIASCPSDMCVSHLTVGHNLDNSQEQSVFNLLPNYLIVKGGFTIEYIKFSIGEATKWDAYIDLLPKSFNTPLFFKDSDLEWIKGTNLYPSIFELKKSILSEYNKIADFVPDKYREFYSLDVYYYIYSIFSSRAFPSRIILEKVDNTTMNLKNSLDTNFTEDLKNDDSYPILLPIVDLLNHESLASVTWKKEYKSLSLITESNILKDEQVFNNYGAKSNEEFLLGYGFTIPFYEFDSVPLKIKVTNMEKERRCLFPFEEKKFFLVKNKNNNKIPLDLLKIFTVSTASDIEFNILKSDKNLIFASMNNLLRAFENIKVALLTKLNSILNCPVQHREPTNIRQEYCQIYRDSQILIYKEYIKRLIKTQFRILEIAVEFPIGFDDEDERRVYFWPEKMSYAQSKFTSALNNFLSLEKILTKYKKAADVLLESFQCYSAEEIRESDAEFEALIMFIIYEYLSGNNLDSELDSWLEAMYTKYYDPNLNGLDSEFDNTAGLISELEEKFSSISVHNDLKEELSPITPQIINWGCAVLNNESFTYNGKTFLITTQVSLSELTKIIS